MHALTEDDVLATIQMHQQSVRFYYDRLMRLRELLAALPADLRTLQPPQGFESWGAWEKEVREVIA